MCFAFLYIPLIYKVIINYLDLAPINARSPTIVVAVWVPAWLVVCWLLWLLILV